jgi:hypothetical protein
LPLYHLVVGKDRIRLHFRRLILRLLPNLDNLHQRLWYRSCNLMKCMTCYVFCQNILRLSIFVKNMHIRLILTKINLDRISSLFKTTKQIKSKLCWESHWCSPFRIVSDSHDLNPKCRPLLKIEILPMPKSPYFN